AGARQYSADYRYHVIHSFFPQCCTDLVARSKDVLQGEAAQSIARSGHYDEAKIGCTDRLRGVCGGSKPSRDLISESLHYAGLESGESAVSQSFDESWINI